MKFKLTILLFVLINCNFNVTAQWVNCNGPNGAEILCVGVKGNEVMAVCSFGNSNHWSQLFRSVDLGETWSPVLCTNGYVIRDIAFQDSLIFMSTSDSGVYRSVDHGITWLPSLNGLASNECTSLAVVGNQVFVAIAAGVYVTADGGINWTNVSSGLPTQYFVHDLATNGQQLFAATPVGMYRTDDWGQSWQASNNGLAGYDIRSIAARDSNVIAGSQGDGVFFSADLGNTWSNVGFSISAIKDVSFYGDTLVVGKNNGVFYSPDHGQTWAPSNTGMGFREITKLAVDDSTILAGTMGGLYKSYQVPSNWSLKGLPALDVIAMGGFGNVLFAGTINENGESAGVTVSKNNGTSWKPVNAGLPFQNLYNEFPACFLAVDNSMLMSLYNHGLFMTADTGSTWVTASNGIADSQIVALRMHDGILYALGNTGLIHTSVDSAQTWNLFSSITLTNSNLVDIAFLDTSLYVATSGNDGVFVSNDNGVSWTAINNGLNSANIWSMTVLDTILFVGTQPGGIHKSIDYGLTWIPYNFGTPEPWISALISVNNHVFAGTVFHSGIVYSADAGDSWSDLSYGLYPKLDIVDIRSFYVNNDYLFVSTGSWRTRFSIYRRPLSDFTGLAEQISEPNEIQLYPNPANTQVTIRMHERIQSGQLEILDLSGKLHLKRSIQNTTSLRLNISNLSPGMYLVSILTAKKSYYRKLIVAGF